MIEVNGLNINAVQKGKGQDILLLHGWRQNIQMMQPIFDHFESDFRVTVLDFPGFGESDEPKKPWGVEDYAVFLKDFCDLMNISNPIIVGHSFGCRVAIHYAVKHNVCKMVLTGAAGIKPKRHLDYYLKTYSYKAAKKLVNLTKNEELIESFKNSSGSDDYKNASGIFRETFVKVVNDDVTDLLDKISIPVLLIFGENDEQTPIWMGKVMEEKMKDAALIIFEKDDHFAYFHQSARFNNILDAFFEPERNK